MISQFEVGQLLVGAWESFRSCRFEVVSSLNRQVFRTIALELLEPPSRKMISSAGYVHESLSQSLEPFLRSKVWVRKPGDWREERLSTDREVLAVDAVSGGEKVQMASGRPAIRTSLPAEGAEGRDDAMAILVFADLLNPRWVPSPMLDVLSEEGCCGHPVVRVSLPMVAVSDRCPTEFEGSDRLEALVHSVRGVLLQLSGYRSGAEWRRYQMVDLEFDLDMADSLFALKR